MFRHVLHPIDGSAASTQAARTLAKMLTGAKSRVTLAVVIQPMNADATDYDDDVIAKQNTRMRDKAEQTLATAAKVFTEAGVEHDTRIIEGDPVSVALANAVDGGDYDAIAMGSRGLGMDKTDMHYLGSVTERVIRKVSLPVLVIPVRREG